MSKGFLTAAGRERLSTYPEDISSEDLGRFFTLTSHDLNIVEQQRSDYNRLGFALQLCTLRYLGFIPNNLLDPPQVVVNLLAYQLDVSAAAIKAYGEREQTRSDHLGQILNYLDYRRASPLDLSQLEAWLVERALEHDQPTFLLHTALDRLRWDRILRPGLTSLERTVSTARQQARQITFERVSHLLTPAGEKFLNNLLERDQEGYRTTLSWLQRMPNDHTAPQIMATLDKIRFLQQAQVPAWDLSTINPNRLKFLANIGARATNQQLQRSSELVRYPVLIAFLKQTLIDLTDVVIDLFDACLWQRHADAKAELDEMRLKAARSTNEKLRTYYEVVKIVIDDTVPATAVRAAIFERFESDHLQQVVEETENLIRPDNDEAIDLFAKRYSYIRQFAPSFLTTLTFKSHERTDPLLDAIKVLRALNASGKRAVPGDAPRDFITNAWWDYVLDNNGKLNRRYYELAVLWELRLALRAGDVFVQNARRYADPSTYLIPREEWPEQRQEVIRLTSTPPNGETRLQDLEAELQILAEQVETLLDDQSSWLREEKGEWILTPLKGEDKPESAQVLEEAMAQRLPRLDITDLLIEVDRWTNYTRHLNHASVGTSSQTEQELPYLYASLLAQGGNFSLVQMSRSSGLAHHRLVYTNTWFIREETLKQANTGLVNYHHALDVSHLWGTGTLSSSNGQRFPVSGKNRTARSILRYFGYRRGVTFYTWTSDQFSLYGAKRLPLPSVTPPMSSMRSWPTRLNCPSWSIQPTQAATPRLCSLFSTCWG
jgi:TnpA family transposase